MERTPDSPRVIIFPPLLFAGTLLVGLALHWLRPIPILPPLAARIIGVVILLASGALARLAELAMKRAGTNIRPDRPSTAIVTDGPFRYTRNPLYLAAAGLLTAIALLVNGLWILVLLVPMLLVLHWGVVRREERYLEAKFGEQYRDYRDHVKRWL